MEDTYTFTARSQNDPSKVATFTLQGDQMIVDTASALEQVDRALTGEQTDEIEDIASKNGHNRQLPWLKPAGAWALQRVTKPINVADVDAEHVEDGLKVRLWGRAAGLRLAPVSFTWETIDNPDAAEAFVGELEERQQAADHPGPFHGILDYWAVWLAGLLGFGLLLRQQLKGKKQEPEAA